MVFPDWIKKFLSLKTSHRLYQQVYVARTLDYTFVAIGYQRTQDAQVLDTSPHLHISSTSRRKRIEDMMSRGRPSISCQKGVDQWVLFSQYSCTVCAVAPSRRAQRNRWETVERPSLWARTEGCGHPSWVDPQAHLCEDTSAGLCSTVGKSRNRRGCLGTGTYRSSTAVH